MTDVSEVNALVVHQFDENRPVHKASCYLGRMGEAEGTAGSEDDKDDERLNVIEHRINDAKDV